MPFEQGVGRFLLKAWKIFLPPLQKKCTARAKNTFFPEEFREATISTPQAGSSKLLSSGRGMCD
jgi:hypothetical protein